MYFSMDLSSLLGRLRVSPSSARPSCLPDDGQPFPPITEVLHQLQDNLSGVAQKDNCYLEKASAIGQAEQLFKTADSHWLTSPDDGDATNGAPACAGRAALLGAYVGVVQALAGCAALPACEADSGPPAGLYRDIPAGALLVCSALCGLLGRLGPGGGEEGAEDGGEGGRPRGRPRPLVAGGRRGRRTGGRGGRPRPLVAGPEPSS